MNKFVIAIATVAAGATMMVAAPASARVNWSVNVGVGGYGYYPAPVYAPRAYYPPPVIYAPPPVYVQPAYPQPVYVQPAQYAQPVYIQRPAPVPVYQDPRYVPPDYYPGGYQRNYREYPDYSRPR